MSSFSFRSLWIFSFLPSFKNKKNKIIYIYISIFAVYHWLLVREMKMYGGMLEFFGF